MNNAAAIFTENIDSVREALTDLGMSDAEISVFSTLLFRGARQASSLAKLSGLTRTYMYAILDRLIARGLVSVNERRGVRHFSAMPFEELLNMLEQKQAAIQRHREQLKNVADLFESQPGLWTDPVSRSDRGAESRARLFQELTGGSGIPRYLFCRAEKSTIFEESPYTLDGLEQVLLLGGAGLRLLLFSQDARGTEIATALGSDAVAVVNAELEAELLISERKITVIGNSGRTPCSITFEQQALVTTLSTFAASFFTSVKASESVSEQETSPRPTESPITLQQRKRPCRTN